MTQSENELAAREFSRRKSNLVRALKSAKSCLTREAASLFASAQFSTDGTRLVGNGYSLEWRIREHPELPESYDNQQTRVGCVVFVRQ